MIAEKIAQDVKLLLGGSVLSMELTDEELTRLVHLAFSFIAPYLGNTKQITKAMAPCIDLKSEGVTEVLRIWRGDSMMVRNGQELLFDFQKFRRVRGIGELTERQIVQRYAIDDIFIPFTFEGGKLYISEGVASGNITIECVTDVSIEDMEANGKPYLWVFRMAHVLAKEAIGRIRGKFTSQSLPVALDGNVLLQEVQSEKAGLLAELKEQNWGPVFVLR